jgi:PTS system nitrogen regulatory IIA component
MLPKDFLSQNSVATGVQIQSKKRLLEFIAELFAENNSQTQATDIFERLIERERLGSTGLGKGIALPHARIDGLEQARAVFVRLENSIDFDAIDNQPVDLVIALLVPADATDAHLQILAGLARFFNEESNCSRLREVNDKQQLAEILMTGIESSQQTERPPG